MQTVQTVNPGDVLLYRSSSLFGWAIRVKTWSVVNHTETYIGNMEAAASRDGKGVATYEVRRKGLRFICRPNVPFDFNNGLMWHESVKGQEYDTTGLLVFYLAKKAGDNNKMFCSEHTARMANIMDIYPFGKRYDCDRVSPGHFLATSKYDVIEVKDQDALRWL